MTEQVVPGPATNGRESERNSSSTSVVFAWVGAILVNAAFAALVTWGVATNWPVGVALCAVYAIVLYFVTGWLVQRNAHDKPGRSGNTVLTSLLYLLFIGAVAVTGLLIPLNVFKCGDSTVIDYPYETQNAYITDATKFPNDVQTWYANESAYQSRTMSSFAYLPLSDTTVFQGQSSSDTTLWVTGVWTVSAGQSPSKINGIYSPQEFVVVSGNSTDTEKACFMCYSDDMFSNSAICCTNGVATSVTTARFGRVPFDLFASNDGLLWFRSEPEGSSFYVSSAVYSIDPMDLSNTLIMHSAKKSGGDSTGYPNANEECASSIRYLSLTVLAISVLPVILSSVWLYRRRMIPSMSLSLYGGITGLIITLTYVINPVFDNLGELLRWWFYFSSLIWLLISTGAHLTNRLKSNTLSWSINVSGLIYFISLFGMFHVPFGGDTYDRVGYWILITIVGFIPLMLLSVVTGRVLLMVLGAIGLLIDVWRFSDYIVGQADESVRVPVQFIILALAGLGIGVLGYFLSKRQKYFHDRIDAWSNQYLRRWRLQDHNQIETISPDSAHDVLVLSEEGVTSEKAVAQTGIVLS